MADPLTTGMILAGGAQMLGQFGNMYSQANMNRKNRQFARQQARQQQAFTWDMWNKTNEYNSPVAQMARFKEAGLNPHLIYGKGTAGNATASSAPAQAKWQGIAPQQNMDVPGLLGLYSDLKLRNVQISNQEQIGLNLIQDNITKSLNNQYKAIKLKYADSLESWSAEAMKEMARKRNQEFKNAGEKFKMLQEQVDYMIWKNNFIKTNKYAPDAAPTPWKFIYEIKSFLSNLPKKPINLGELKKSAGSLGDLFR